MFIETENIETENDAAECQGGVKERGCDGFWLVL